MFRESMAAMNMQVMTTFVPIGPTYFSCRGGAASWIDHWATPVGKCCHIRTLLRSMARLQIIQNTEPRDHAPVRL